VGARREVAAVPFGIAHEGAIGLPIEPENRGVVS